MKSVIVEIKDGFAAVLSDDGSVTKIKNNNYLIGQVIKMKKPKISNIRKFAVCAASIAILALGGGISAWAYTTPYTYVSLDVNPSIEFSVNRFDRVIKVTAVNDDGEAILNQINLKDLSNQTIEDAIVQTVNQIRDSGYFTNVNTVSGSAINAVSGSAIKIDVNIDATVEITPDGGIVIVTSSEDKEKSEELANELQQSIEDAINATGDNVEVEALSVGYERVQEARELGVTPGKLNLVEKLQASAENPESIDVEEWLDKPVKEIMRTIKENKKALKNNSDTATTVTPTPTATPTTTPTTPTATPTTAPTVTPTPIITTIVTPTPVVTSEKEKKEAEKELKAEEKAAEKAKKEAEKALEAEEKAKEKVEKASGKAADKVEKTIDNAADKVEKAKDKAEKASGNANEKAEKAEDNNSMNQGNSDKKDTGNSGKANDKTENSNNSGKGKGKN